MTIRTQSRPASYLGRFAWVVFAFGSTGLFAASVYRAATFPLVHDESLSFAIFNWEPLYRLQANHHVLNTLLMQWSANLFGPWELALRIPNILAHGIYLVSGLLLLKGFENVVLRIMGFVLLNLNPFLLDFFFLARGYGLALGFLMLSLYLLVRAYREKPARGFAFYLFLSVAAGSLSVLANFSFLNYYLPLLLASLWVLLSEPSMRRFSRRNIWSAITLVSASGIFLAMTLPKVFELRRHGQIYWGGRESFIGDTVGSLVVCSLYRKMYSPDADKILSAILVGMFFLFLLFGLYLFFVRKEVSLFTLVLVILVGMVALPILQHRLLGTLFPIERAALYYLPLYSILLVSAVERVLALSSRRWQRIAALILAVVSTSAFGFHFYRSFETDVCYTWWYDGHNKEILEIVDRDRRTNLPNQTLTLGISWMMEPSLNYYRITRDHSWLLPLTRELIGANADYVYTFESEVKDLPIGPYATLASYPDTNTVLLRVKR